MTTEHGYVKLIIDFKRQKVIIGRRKYTTSCEENINIYDLGTTADDDFERLHQQLAIFCQQHKCRIEQLHRLMAHTTVVRIIHFTGELRLPKYLAVTLQRLYIDANACVPSGSTLRKTQEYVEFLARVVPKIGTTVDAHQRERFKYVLPLNDDLEMMSIEMIDEEIRLCEQSRGKYKKDDLAVLRDLRKIKHQNQQYDKEATKQPRKSDQERLREEIKLMKKERKTERKTKSSNGKEENE